MSTNEYNLLYFPNEILCEIYSHMNQAERMSLRTTCKQFYLMFKQEIPAEKVKEWKNKLITLMGISFAEKLLVYQKVNFVYQIPKMTGISWNFRTGYQREFLTFFVDPNCASDDNLRFSFVFKAGYNFPQEYIHLIEPTNTFIMNDETDTASGVFKFKDCPKNVFTSENVDYICNLMVNMFYKFICRPQHKNADKTLNYRLSQILEDVVDRPNEFKTHLFTMFDNSVFVSVPVEEEERAAREALVNKPSNEKKMYIYQEKASRLIDELRRDMKSYFFDGKDGKKCML
jgi:hypothetical protein